MYRLIAQERDLPRANILTTRDSNLRLVRDALVGVALGCQCDEDCAMEVIDRHGRGLRARRAKRLKDCYSLTLETVDSNRGRDDLND